MIVASLAVFVPGVRIDHGATGLIPFITRRCQWWTERSPAQPLRHTHPQAQAAAAG